MRPGPSAELKIIEGKADRLRRGATLVSDRDYVVRDLPKELEGKRFIYSRIDRTGAVCTKPGVVYLITPSEGRNRDSLESQLIARGFRKTSLPEFLLFGKISGNVCSVFQKELDAGEQIELGKWGVLVYGTAGNGDSNVRPDR
jgi:hypothetical protein